MKATVERDGNAAEAQRNHPTAGVLGASQATIEPSPRRIGADTRPSRCGAAVRCRRNRHVLHRHRIIPSRRTEIRLGTRRPDAQERDAVIVEDLEECAGAVLDEDLVAESVLKLNLDVCEPRGKGRQTHRDTATRFLVRAHAVHERSHEDERSDNNPQGGSRRPSRCRSRSASQLVVHVGISPNTRSGVETEGTGPSAVVLLMKSMYSPAGATAAAAGILTCRKFAPRTAMGSITARWSPSTRWVIAVRRINTADSIFCG